MYIWKSKKPAQQMLMEEKFSTKRFKYFFFPFLLLFLCVLSKTENFLEPSWKNFVDFILLDFYEEFYGHKCGL